jgi:hypothetical protein
VNALPQQSELFAVETVSGYGALGRKERLFAQALFEGCNQSEAARRAGVTGSDEYIRKAASKLVTKGNVQALMNQAWARSGASIDDTLRQAAELQRRTFREAQEAPSPERRKEAFTQWRESSALIASIHGKLQLKISADVHHSGEISLTVPETALPVLAQMRRETHAQGGRN